MAGKFRREEISNTRGTISHERVDEQPRMRGCSEWLWQRQRLEGEGSFQTCVGDEHELICVYMRWNAGHRAQLIGRLLF